MIRVVSFTIDLRCHGCMTMTLKSSTHNEQKSAVAERFTRNLMTNIYKHVTAVSENMYINKLDEIVENTITHIIEQSK